LQPTTQKTEKCKLFFILAILTTLWAFIYLKDKITPPLIKKGKQAYDFFYKDQGIAFKIGVVLAFIACTYLVFLAKKMGLYEKLITFSIVSALSIVVVLIWSWQLIALNANKIYLSVIGTSLAATLVWFAMADTADILNKAYGVDPIIFPLAQKAGVAIKVAGYISVPMLLCVGLMQFIAVLSIFKHLKDSTSRPKKITEFFACLLDDIVPFSVLAMAFMTSDAMSEFGLKHDRTIIPYIAYEKDFYSAFNYCIIPKTDESGDAYKAIWTSPSQDRILVVSKESIEKFMKNGKKANIPSIESFSTRCHTP